MEKQEFAQVTEISKAIKLLEGLKTSSKVSKPQTALIETTLGKLGRVFRDIDPDDAQSIVIKVEISFDPLEISITFTF